MLSFDNLMGAAGGVIAQPAFGRVADVNGYAASYLVAAGVGDLRAVPRPRPPGEGELRPDRAAGPADP